MKIGRKFFERKKNLCVSGKLYAWDIYGAYTRPSQEKVAIWEDWKKWFWGNCEGKHDYIGISSYNTFMFTICGVITINDIEYAFYITPSHNYINPI